MQVKTVSVKLTFLEPYRMAKWIDWDDRENDVRAMRGQTFVQWKDEGTGGLPIITGSIIRSATLKAAEEILSLNNGTWENINCCNGAFQTAKQDEAPAFLRKRHTLQWNANNECTDNNNMCPYCILLGRFDTSGKDHKKYKYKKEDYHIHFGNFYLGKKYKKNGMHIEDVALGRILNRVDFDTGKAKDYFRTWEADFEAMPEYEGKITINKHGEEAECLLLHSLGFIDKLCGALCKIEVIQRTEPSSISYEKQTPSPGKPQTGPKLPDKQKDDLLKSCAVEITKAFKDADCLEKVRTLADAIRSMRLQKPDILDKLPEGRKGRDNKHHLWDREVDKKPVRIILKELWESFAPGVASGEIEELKKEELRKKAWRHFAETLGSYLYFFYKKDTGGISLRYRPLGETEYSKTHNAEREKGADLFIPLIPQGGTKAIKE
ncbi:MAG: hypothetical protein E3K37_02485 [Candidatus Kuenenia sp.]|nr:hypothetical protein [Candidatus Kuenenia hertensis]